MGILDLRVSGRVNSGRYGICYSFFCDLLVFTFVFLISRSSRVLGNVEMIDSELSTPPCTIYVGLGLPRPGKYVHH